MPNVECPSCGSLTPADAPACTTCGRRRAWGGTAHPPPATSQEPGTLFGDAPSVETSAAPWQAREGSQSHDDLDEYVERARSMLLAAGVAAVLVGVALYLYAGAETSVPQAVASNSAAQFERFVFDRSRNIVGRSIVTILAASLAGFAMIGGWSTRTKIVGSERLGAIASAGWAAIAGAVELAVLLWGILYYRPF